MTLVLVLPVKYSRKVILTEQLHFEYVLCICIFRCILVFSRRKITMAEMPEIMMTEPNERISDGKKLSSK